MSVLREYHNKIKKLNVSNEQDLNQIIDKINALDLADITIESELIVSLLCDIVDLIPSSNDHLLSKFCSFVSFVFKKLNVKYDVSNKVLIQFLSQKLSSCGAWVLGDVLVAFTNLVNSSDHIEIEMVKFLFSEDSVLLNSLANDEQDANVQYNSFLCVFALLKNLGESALPTENLDLCCQKCLLVLKNKPCAVVDPLSLKILISSLKILQLVFSSKNATIKNLGEVLGILKSLLFYGLPGQSFLPSSGLIPTLSCPDVAQFQESQSESDASFPRIRKPKKNKRRTKKTHPKTQSEAAASCEKNFNTADSSVYPSSSFFKDIKIKPSSSDDSELSDIEINTSKIKAHFSSVRQNAYLTVQAVVMLVDQKSMFGYWTSFLPDHPVMPGMPSTPTIFTTILKDPASQVRLSALNLLIEMFRGSKPYLALADARSMKHTAFTSLSSILTSMITETHRCLLLTTLAENSAVLLIQILKCYAVLAENVPYFKVNKEILFKFLKHIKVFLYHKDIPVQVACLSVFTSILNSDQTPGELEILMLSSEFDDTINLLISNSSKNYSSNDEQLPWIVEVCHRNIFIENYLSTRIQSLQLLCSFTRKYFHKLRLFFPVLKETVLFCLNNSDFTVQLHGVKLMDIIGRCLNNIPEEEKFLKGFVSELFLETVTGPLIKCLTNDEHKTLQVAVCDCLSTVPASDFALLDTKYQNLYISILLGLASDSNANVKGASIRCLGIFSLFPCLIQDASFYDNLGVILVNIVKDPNINVRFKASWALGNLSDAIFLNREAFLSNEGISVQFFHSIGMACIECSKDSDRVKANAVRSLGNFLHFIPEHYLDLNSVEDFIKSACEALLLALSANFMKVCWNACYALKSMMKNEALIGRDIVKSEDVLKSLVAVLKSPNFKVRISAVQAISSLTSRKQYGTVFPLVFKQILISLQSSLDDVNFKEIKHQQNLCHQLCHTLCHLVSLMTIEDFCHIEKEVMFSKETLLVSMWKFGSSLSEENFNVTIAVKHLSSLTDSIQDEEHNKLLVTLQDILNQAILAYSQQECKNRFI